MKYQQQNHYNNSDVKSFNKSSRCGLILDFDWMPSLNKAPYVVPGMLNSVDTIEIIRTEWHNFVNVWSNLVQLTLVCNFGTVLVHFCTKLLNYCTNFENFCTNLVHFCTDKL